ncbi:MAG: hypothetical protein WCI11_15190 [Candidatus Methylumidiphilus sp.]
MQTPTGFGKCRSPDGAARRRNPGDATENPDCAAGRLHPGYLLVQAASYRPWLWIPAVHAGMTAFLGRRDLCITMRAPAWARGQRNPMPHNTQAPALAVIHKCKRPVIPAWTAGIQSQGCESRGRHQAFFKHLTHDMSPSVALDSGIHAGMTAMEP